MNTILQGWNFMRIIRLVLAIVILVQGIAAGEAVSIILGVAFGGMAIANIGCCGATGCTVGQRSTNNKSKAIEYEEVVADK
jgi:hypothetical protein